MWVVDDFSKLVCVKSSDHALWMRAKVIKQNNAQSVSLLLRRLIFDIYSAHSNCKNYKIRSEIAMFCVAIHKIYAILLLYIYIKDMR